MNKTFLIVVLPLVLLLTLTTSAEAQFQIIDQLGQPFLTKEYTDIKGSPYMFEDWKSGSVTTTNGKTYVGVHLKYDQVANELLFKSEKGEPRAFIQPVKQFTIQTIGDDIKASELLFRREYKPVDGASVSTFYEVLVDGETQLLKRTAKRVVENSDYNSASKTKYFQSDSFYYLAQNGELSRIKKDKKSVLKRLSNKQKELETYIKANRLDLKKDADLAKLISYYNTL